MRVSICDGHRTFGEGLACLLVSRGHVIVGCDVTVSEAVEAARSGRPDVVVTDLHVRDGHGHEVVGRLRSGLPFVPLVVLTGDSDIEQLRAALRSGADGFVFKKEGVDELERVMIGLGVSERETEGTKGRARPVWSRQTLAAQARQVPLPPVGITPRGLAVIELLMVGADTMAMARAMGITPATVRTHIQNLFEQMGVHSRGELIAAAVRQGLVDPQPVWPAYEAQDVQHEPLSPDPVAMTGR
jgi:DNA-binding NarL/FixJ family response regulator